MAAIAELEAVEKMLVVVAAALAAAVVPSAALAADPERVLADRFAPVVRLVEQKEPCGHGEAFEPTDVNLVLGNPDVALRGPWDRTNIIKVAPTAPDLVSSVVYAIVLPFTAIATTYLYFDLRVAKQNEGAADNADILPVEAASVGS